MGGGGGEEGGENLGDTLQALVRHPSLEEWCRKARLVCVRVCVCVCVCVSE